MCALICPAAFVPFHSVSYTFTSLNKHTNVTCAPIMHIVNVTLCACACVRQVQAESPAEITECWLRISSVQLYLLPVSQAFRLSLPLAKAQLWYHFKHFLAPASFLCEQRQWKCFFYAASLCLVCLVLHYICLQVEIFHSVIPSQTSIRTAFQKIQYVSVHILI